jgi:Ca2+:H+ antiporter
MGLNQDFVGLTIIAFVPAFTEFVGTSLLYLSLSLFLSLLHTSTIACIKFALQDNIALSIEVATSYSVQISLVQMPLLVFFSAFSGSDFKLLFRSLDVFAVRFLL